MWSKAVVNTPGEKCSVPGHNLVTYKRRLARSTELSSAYIKVSPDLIDEGKSFVKSVNKVGPNTEQSRTQSLADTRNMY